MRVLSFDVGIKNLAWCILKYEPETKTFKCEDLVLKSLLNDKEHCGNVTQTELMHRAIIICKNLGTDYDYVVIERQPYRGLDNIKCRRVMYALEDFYHSRDITVKLMNARNKFNSFKHIQMNIMLDHDDFNNDEEEAYKRRKLKSILIAEMLCDDGIIHEVDLESFEKKDDVADALLQCVAFMIQLGCDIEYKEKEIEYDGVEWWLLSDEEARELDKKRDQGICENFKKILRKCKEEDERIQEMKLQDILNQIETN